MNPIKSKLTVILLLSWSFALGETASINVTLSSHNIQNGTSMNLTVAFDPTIGNALLSDVSCRYIKPGESGYTAITRYNTRKTEIIFDAGLSSSQRSRMSITSSGNATILTISNIIFSDEKTSYYCHLAYYDSDDNLLTMDSNTLILENVYSLPTVNDTSSIQLSTTLTEGIAANLACVATGRPQSNITWQYNSAIISANSSNVYEGSPLITTTNVLTINYPTRSMDGQQITCSISHQFSATMSRTTTLSVDYRPVNTTFTIDPQNPKLNQMIKLSCSAIAKPGVTMYRFYVNDTSIGNSTSGNLSVNANDCLRFNGNFKCVPENARGQGEMKQQLIVVTDDVKTSVASASLTFNETQNGTLHCNVSGCPNPLVSWKKDGTLLNRYGNSLTLAMLNKSNAGQYSCHAQNGYTNASSQIQVIVNYKPDTTTMVANNNKPLVNTSVTFTCTSNAVPEAKFRFYRIDSKGESAVSSLTSETRGNLVVSNILHTNSSYNVTYKCVPYNFLGNGPEKTVMLDVQVPPKINQFTVNPSIVNETGNATFECTASGNPAPNITITGPNNAVVQHSNGKGMLQSISRNQGGSYTCAANNGVGSPVNAAVDLVVHYVPYILNFTSIPSKVYTGSSLSISCNASGIPTPHFRFYSQNGTLLRDSASNLYTQIVRYEDYSNYRVTFKCIPYNSLGVGMAQNLTVEILVPPRISVSMSPHTVNESQNATFSCVVAAANPTANITLRRPTNQTIEHTQGTAILKNLTRNDAGMYSCLAENGVIGSPVISTISLTVNHEPDQVRLTSSSLKPTTGSSVTLTCTARASPSASFRFISINGSSETVQDSAFANYTISPLDYKKYNNYVANYGCIAYNSFGNSSMQTVVLDIQVPPLITFSLTPNIVNEGQNATAECKVNAANPAPNITIMDNINQDIPHVGGQATMSHRTRNQAGRYTCMATNGIGGVVTATANLTVYYAPDQVQLRASSLTPTNGSSVNLTCSARAIPPPTMYIFTKGSSQITVQNSSSPTYTIGAIDYRNFVKYNAMFGCVAYNLVGGGSSSNVTLNIQVGPQISVSPGMTVVEGENVVLYCNVTAANPMASITWSHPSSGVISNTNGMILFPSIKRNQHAVYSCIASNGVGPAVIRTTSLVVNYGPEIEQNSTEYEQCKGTNARIVCSAVGRPPPDVSLQLKNNILIRNSSTLTYNFQVDTDAKFGSYVCVSNNTVGTVNVTTIIKSKPLGTVTDINLTVKDDTIRVTWNLPQCASSINEIKIQYRKRTQSGWPYEEKAANPSDKEVTIKGLEKGVEYEVQVVVVDSSGRSFPKQAATIAKTESPKKKSNAALIGGIVGGLCLLFIIIAVCYYFGKKRRESTAAESLGYTNQGADTEKNKSATIEMTDVDHYKAPDGSVYASVKGKSGNVNGAIDNANFVADSDGAYDPVNGEPEKKKDESNYAELGTFKSPNNNEKPKDKPKTEYATLEELGPLTDYEEPQKPKEEDSQTHKITVEPESGEDATADKGESGNAAGTSAPAADASAAAPASDASAAAPASDTSTTAPASDTSTTAPASDTSTTAPASDASNDVGLSGSVDMI